MHDATGSWELPEEHRMLRDTIRRFMQEEVKPLEDTLPYDCYTPEPAQLAAFIKAEHARWGEVVRAGKRQVFTRAELFSEKDGVRKLVANGEALLLRA